MIPDDSILEKGEELVALAAKYGASNIRFFGDVVSKKPQPGCGVDIIVDVERGKTTKEDIEALKEEFQQLLGREVGVNSPNMFLPPVFEILSDEFVHLDVLLDRSTDHLVGTNVDPGVIENRLELLVIAKRYGLVNLRLVGECVRKSHKPDCSVRIWGDVEGRVFMDPLRLYGIESRMGRVLGRMVTINLPNRMTPPPFRDELREAVPL